MKDDLIKKIGETVAKSDKIKEPDVRSLMILVRKYLDKMPNSDQNNFLIIRLFCNWTAHIEITNSNTGLRILAEINDTLVDVKKEDTTVVQNKLSQAIGYPALRKELKSFFNYIDVDDVLVSDNTVWAIFITYLIEIIRDVPLSFPPLSKLDPTKLKIYNQIAQNTIKPGAGVISIQISQVDNKDFGVKDEGVTMCLIIKTEDTTTIVVPIVIDVRV